MYRLGVLLLVLATCEATTSSHHSHEETYRVVTEKPYVMGCLMKATFLLLVIVASMALTNAWMTSSCDSWIDFAKSGCVNSWAEVQADDFHFVCKIVKYLQEQVIQLRHMILMMTGQGETEVSRGGENGESRGGETEESRGGETEESRGGETEESRGGETEENKESSGNVREKAGKKKKDDRRQRMQQKRGKRVSGEGLPGGKTVKVDDRRERGRTSSVQQERSFADVVSHGKARKARVFMGDSIIRKVDKIVNRGDDITVCLPGAKVEDIAEKAGQVMGGGTGGGVLVHVGTNNAEKEGTSAIVGKYRRLIKTLKEARVGQIVLSGILPIMGGRGEENRNCRRMAINTQV
ncbi:hypothetical protein LSAT2_010238 [Lamellibrachia satsuma]|nr:hypothetical protein LSAT2_010238 [Lamellibrachia satsuma]